MGTQGWGDYAATLPWLCPSASACNAFLAPTTKKLWNGVRLDPAALLHLVRFGIQDDIASPVLQHTRMVTTGDLIEPLFDQLQTKPAEVYLDWRHPATMGLFKVACDTANNAATIAQQIGYPFQSAWVAGMLCYLPWFAISSASTEAIYSCLSHPRFSEDPWGTQLQHWGQSQVDLAHRLVENWHLPNWLGTLLTRIDWCPDEVDQQIDPTLHAVCQLAVVAANDNTLPFIDPDLIDRSAAFRALQLNPHSISTLGDRAELELDIAVLDDRSPHTSAELLEDLQEAILARNENSASAINFYQQRVAVLENKLHEAGQRRTTEEQAGKLRGLAELAAGASHEINNPLAVISTQAQYLLKNENAPDKVASLESIVRQTRNIHNILRELMLFARPPAPARAWLNLGNTLKTALLQLQIYAEAGGVQWECNLPQYVEIHIDEKYLIHIVAALVRNAIQAAGADGWVRIGWENQNDQHVLFVEDSGSGPAPKDVEHLFDPFFSGRDAGRGRGLGLSTSWRLAEQMGTTVVYQPKDSGITRFEFRLPTSMVKEQRLRYVA
ncbi:MAG: HAMP domain-containing sensor histidine kinase [Zavarzinella sp.]